MNKTQNFPIGDSVEGLRDVMCAPVQGLLCPVRWTERAKAAVQDAGKKVEEFRNALVPLGIKAESVLSYTDLSYWRNGLMGLSKEGNLLFIYAHSGEREPDIVQGVRQLDIVEGRCVWHYWITPCEPWGVASIPDKPSVVFLVENELVALYMRLAFSAQQHCWRNGGDSQTSKYAPSVIFISAPPQGVFNGRSLDILRNHDVVAVLSQDDNGGLRSSVSYLKNNGIKCCVVDYFKTEEDMRQLAAAQSLSSLAVDFEVMLTNEHPELFKKWISGAVAGSSEYRSALVG